MRILRTCWSLAVLTALVCAGCGQKLYRAETRLLADGRVLRAIYQPADDTPAAALDAAQWTGVTYAGEIDKDRWTGKIADLPAAKRDDYHTYFAAWGEFASPDRLPSSYVAAAPAGLPDGRLRVVHRRTDYVFVVEDDWRETLTDIVTLDDLQRSRRQLLDLLLPLVERCLAAVLGPEYDVSGLVHWFNTTGRSWFVEATDAFYEAGTRDQLPPNKQWEQALAEVCGRYGLELRDANGRLLDNFRMRAAVAEFAAKVLGEHLKRHDGAPVSPVVISDLLEWVNLKDPPRTPNPRLGRFDALTDDILTEQFGGQQQFVELVTPMTVRMLGLYRVDVLGPPRRFHYQMQMPGSIVETNGVLAADDMVSWSFEAVQAYPFGYEMHCRSVVPNVELQRRLLGAAPLADRGAMNAFIAAVQSDFLLGDALRKCQQGQSMRPLLEARQRTEKEGGRLAPYDTVIGLLRVSPEN